MPVHRIALLTVFILYWLGLFVLTHLPELPIDTAARYNDKVAHTVSYAVLMVLALVGSRHRQATTARLITMWLPILAAYAAVDELSQPIFGRSCQLTDWLADLAGLVTATLCYLATTQIKTRFTKTR
jgi:VanZ family protein